MGDNEIRKFKSFLSMQIWKVKKIEAEKESF